MKYVLDSSVAIKWELPETDSVKALALRDAFRAAVHELIAPTILAVELAHALTRAERQGRIPVGPAIVLWTDAVGSGTVVFPTRPLLPRAIEEQQKAAVGHIRDPEVISALYGTRALERDIQDIASNSSMSDLPRAGART